LTAGGGVVRGELPASNVFRTGKAANSSGSGRWTGPGTRSRPRSTCVGTPRASSARSWPPRGAVPERACAWPTAGVDAGPLPCWHRTPVGSWSRLHADGVVRQRAHRARRQLDDEGVARGRGTGSPDQYPRLTTSAARKRLKATARSRAAITRSRPWMASRSHGSSRSRASPSSREQRAPLMKASVVGPREHRAFSAALLGPHRPRGWGRGPRTGRRRTSHQEKRTGAGPRSFGRE
jgi:hypothetical protein